MSIVRAEYFGRKASGAISGSMDFVQMFGLVLGPVLAGFMYDVTESYYLAFLVFAISGTLGAITVVFFRSPQQSIAVSIVAHD